MAMTPYKSYASQQIGNESPLLQMAALLNKAAVHMNDAKEAIEKGEIEVRYDYSQKATQILEGLKNSIKRDTPEGAELAKSLDPYYASLITMISRVNVLNDPKLCTSIQDSLKDMARFWTKMASTDMATPDRKQDISTANLSV